MFSSKECVINCYLFNLQDSYDSAEGEDESDDEADDESEQENMDE